MPILEEKVRTALPVEQAFTYVSDFGNAAEWDPGTATAQSVDGGPVQAGSRYLLGVRVGRLVRPMEYVITKLEPNQRVVLRGTGSGVEAVDDIRFRPAPGGGTDIDYRAEIRLVGLMRLLAPFAGRAFEQIARDARDGMQRTLDTLAETRRAA
jgi:hypothetical protein